MLVSFERGLDYSADVIAVEEKREFFFLFVAMVHFGFSDNTWKDDHEECLFSNDSRAGLYALIRVKTFKVFPQIRDFN